MFKEKFNKSIRFKFLSIISVILFVSTLVLSLVIAINEGRVLKNSLMTTGQSFASYIAKLGRDPLIMKDSIQLDAIVTDANKDENIAYTIIRDGQGAPLTSQYASINYRLPRFNAILLELSRDHELQDIIDAIKKKESVIEVSTPIMIDIKTIGAVTIGMSTHKVHQQIVKTILFVIALNVAVAFVLGAVLFVASKKIVFDPLIELAHASSRLAKGDLSTLVKVRTTGEVKTLVDSFNEMVKNLEKVTVSKDYVDNIIRSMINTLIVVSPDDKIIRTNDAACRLLGYEEEEIIGRPAETIFGGERSRKDSWMKTMLADGRVGNIEESYRAKNGREFPVLFSASVMRDDNNLFRGTVYVAQDITERKRAENRLAKLNECFLNFGSNSEENINRLVANCGELMNAACALYNCLEGNILRSVGEWNTPPGFNPVDTPEGHICYDVIQQSLDSPVVIRNLQNTPYFQTDPNVKQYGLHTYVGMAVKLRQIAIGSLCVVYQADIEPSPEELNLMSIIATAIGVEEERKRSLQTIQQSEERYRTILENIEDGYFEVDIAGNYTFFNDSLCRMLGYSRDEMMGMNNRQYTDQENAQKLYQAFNKVYRTGEPTKEFDWEIIIKNGTKRYIEASVSLIKNISGQPIGFRGIVRDITERKNNDEKILRQSTLLDGVNKVLIGALTCQTEGEIANKCLNVAQALTKSKFGFIGEINQAGRFDTIAMSDPGWEACRIPRSDSVLLINNMEMRGIWASVLKEERSMIVNDPAAHPNRVGTPEGHPPLTSFLGVPLKHMRKTIGMIALANKETVYDSIDQQDIETLCTVFVEALMRKRAEEALQESEERYRTILENIEDGYYEVDLPGNFTFFNDSLCRMLGYSKEEMIGMSNQQYTDQENRKKLFQAFNEVYRTGEPTKRFDWEVIRKDRTKLFGEVSASLIKDSKGQPIGFRGIARDITERMMAGQALEKSEVRFQELFNDAPVGYFEYDVEGRIIDVNRTELELLGYRLEEMIGQPVWKFIVEEEAVRQQILQKIAGTLPPAQGFERTYRRKDGTTFPVLVGDRILRDSEGKIIGIRSTIHDITERKRAEQEMEVLQEQLRQSQKMEAIGRLAGGIAHDFNNLLTVIKGYSQLSLVEIKEGDPLKLNIEEIRRAADRAADLTRQLLAFSRRQIMEMKVLDLNDLLKNLDKMLRRVIGEDIELVTLLAEDLGRVKTDPGQTEQVVMNLSVNARDAMPNGGKFTIETANVDLDQTYTRAHVAVAPGRFVMISVSDTGVGMTPEVRDRVFEPFFTTKEKGKGTGLGLSTVYGIVKQSGGNIWVYSEPGKGTTFKIYLPRVDEPLEELGERVEVKEIPRGTETILVVEDEEDVRKLAVRILERQGYKVLEASQGLDAFLIVEKYKDLIHLLVTDVVMPKISGRELAERMASIRPEIKVLYMSGYTDNAIVHHGVLGEGMKFIQKPFTVEGLARKVREVLDKDLKPVV